MKLKVGENRPAYLYFTQNQIIPYCIIANNSPEKGQNTNLALEGKQIESSPYIYRLFRSLLYCGL